MAELFLARRTASARACARASPRESRRVIWRFFSDVTTEVTYRDLTAQKALEAIATRKSDARFIRRETTAIEFHPSRNFRVLIDPSRI